MAEYVRDFGTRSSASGWGTALVGGAWTFTVDSGGTLGSSVASGVASIVKQAATGSVIAYQQLASASAQRDVTMYARLNTVGSVIPAGNNQHFFLMARGSGTIVPFAYSAYAAHVSFLSDGSITLGLVRFVSGTTTTIETRTYPPGTHTGQAWGLEFECIGSPTMVRARIWPLDPPTAPYEDWLMADGDTAGPQVGGWYALRVGRSNYPTAIYTQWNLGGFYVTDPPRPTYTWSILPAPPAAVNRAEVVPAGTGDPVTWAWDFGDGTTATGSGTKQHTYANPGYYHATYTITTRWGTTWSYADAILAAYATYQDKPLHPLLSIGSRDLCDVVFGASWMRGSTYWTDGLIGGSCTLQLRGRVELAMGEPILISIADPDGGIALWRGYVDQVRYDVNPVDASDITQVMGIDIAAYLARMHIAFGTYLSAQQLPGRLAELRPMNKIRYRAKWAPDSASRYPSLKSKAYKADQLRFLTYLDMIRQAMQGSIAFGYVAPNGDIVYAPWNAPPSMGLDIDIDLDGDLDCPSHVALDPRSIAGMVNRWIVGDGSKIDRSATGSIETYGEHAYAVDIGVLVDENTFPLTDGYIAAMRNPKRAPEAEVPMIDTDQHCLWVEPLDLAEWEGRLYTVLGVRHQVDLRSGWRVTLSLDRDPWAVHGQVPPAVLDFTYRGALDAGRIEPIPEAVEPAPEPVAVEVP